MTCLLVLDPVTLSRAQFALTIMFHYLFPPLTIGMGVVLVFLEAQYLWKKEPIYETAAKFWTQLFALNFAMGVATGIVMEFEFGTNWAVYSRFVGDVFGSALAAEGIFAFFLESGFLAVLVFGWDRVGPKFHMLATTAVALGSMFSAIWIIVANSWQQTPAGHQIVQMVRDGHPWIVNGHPVFRAETVHFWQVVFNPSTVNRLVHTLIGAFIMGAFFILSISAYYIVRGRHLDFAKRSFSGALMLATIASCGQLVSGDSNAKMVARNQPDKLAAMEGLFKTGPARLSLFGIPDEKAGQTKYEIGIPGLLSYLVHSNWHAPVVGLDKFHREDWPPVTITFGAYHVMVGLGMYFIGLTLFASFLRWRRKLFDYRWLMWVFVISVAGPVIANELGWATAESGRQPWIVHPPVVRNAAGDLAFDAQGYVQFQPGEGLRTKDAVSESVKGGEILGSIIMFSFIYILLGALWIFVLNHKIHAGPQPVHMPETTTARGFIKATAGRIDHEESMSEAKSPEEDARTPGREDAVT
ncbi:MAG TPA: cytochrome ubiquinol oxidase subunit I [Tepidisphaeraceae bacterium]|nr:cytochrome ubiquinol oxidase subunit I [Tepidisphaeraceae bacterium]